MRSVGLPLGARLTVVTAGLVLAVGTALLVASYWLLMVRLPETVAIDTPNGQVQVPLAGTAQQAAGNGSQDGGKDAGGAAQTGLPPKEVVQSALTDYESQLRRSFAMQSALLLACLALPAVAVGAFAARRALRPVHAMTAAAQRLGAESLGERLPENGPHDELRELACTFNAMLDRIEAAFVRERRLMANVSHELRTPLANQFVTLDVGLEDPHAGADDLRRVAETAMGQNVRARRLIDEILVLGRAEQEEHPADPDDVTDLAAAAAQAVDALEALPDVVRGLDLRLDLAPAPVRGQPLLLERLVGNLVENAARHNVAGGFVAVSTGVTEHGGVLVVENTGPHIEPESVPGLFESFRRGRNGGGDRVRSDRGAGLGLAIVAAVTRRSGGRVDAVARPDGGLSVTVCLPMPTKH